MLPGPTKEEGNLQALVEGTAPTQATQPWHALHLLEEPSVQMQLGQVLFACHDRGNEVAAAGKHEED